MDLVERFSGQILSCVSRSSYGGINITYCLLSKCGAVMLFRIIEREVELDLIENIYISCIYNFFFFGKLSVRITLVRNNCCYVTCIKLAF